MKAFGIILIVLAVVLISFQICGEFRANYQYEREIGSFWNLADKSSSIEKKAEYVDQFVSAVKATDTSGNNAVIFPTPDNLIANNVAAIESLQKRLHEIKTMDVRSFEYQTAIQQITAQEQGEAHSVINQIEGGWRLHNGYWYVWYWIGFIYVIISIAIGIVGVAALADANDWL